MPCTGADMNDGQSLSWGPPETLNGTPCLAAHWMQDNQPDNQ